MWRTFVVAYPWDLVRHDLEESLSRLQGELGVTGLSLWAAAPPVLQGSAGASGAEASRVEGGLTFRPAKGRFASLRCKPIVAAWAQRGDKLRRIVDACESRRLRVRLNVSVAETDGMAGRYPDLASCNVFDRPSSISVCPAAPEIQSYVCTLAAEIAATFPAADLSLTSFSIAWQEAFGEGLGVDVGIPQADPALLGVCYCDVCRKKASAAGVDVGLAARTTRTILEKCADACPDSQRNLDTAIHENESLAALFAWRGRELSALLEEICKAHGGTVVVHRRCAGIHAAADSDVDYGAACGVVTEYDEPSPLSSALCPTARSNELSLPVAIAIRSDGSRLVSLISEAVRVGFSGVEIDHLGLFTDEAYAPVKQAVRFARRTAAEV